MTTRWESSNRPLFVRTVWKDGCRHVLFNADERIKVARSRSSRSASSGTSANRSARNIPPSAQETAANFNFKVSSVKLLLAGLRTLKDDPRAKRWKTENGAPKFTKSAITVDIIPCDSLRLNDINKQVSFNDLPYSRRLANHPKSNSVEVNHRYSFGGGDSERCVSPPPFSYDSYCLDQFNNTLSERVMIWLDLAVQNRRRFENVDTKKRVATAQVTRSIQDVHRQNDQDHEEPEREEEEEEKSDRVSEKRRMKVRPCTAKRQLHIFLPDLLKKSSESSSFLSSKTSSLLQTNNAFK